MLQLPLLFWRLYLVKINLTQLISEKTNQEILYFIASFNTNVTTFSCRKHLISLLENKFEF